MATTGAFSDYVEDLIAKWLFKNTAPTAPATLYVGLFTTTMNDANSTQTEVSTSGTGYARQAISCGTAGTGAGSGWTETTPTTNITNASDILFAVATANYGTVVSVGIFDASSAGNLIFYAVLALSIAINTNDQFKIPAGSLVLTID